ncbi:cation-translocating P-type ATPase [Streptomyces sp. SCSIO ZS0520]|uniref:cation-translocating P-type ATPase n=1 Tax=Streptomyces sp. SCSIO ZS0520 TaxID=2892996 RepID=UPI0021D7FBE2|nr:cation-translocating P-type ATPase [Streptomyces sp. SCSIO ZS0520]
MTQRARTGADDHGSPDRPAGSGAGTDSGPGGSAPAGAQERAPGLSSAEVARRVARGEVNDVPVRSSRSAADIVRGNIFTRFNAIIGVLWVITLVVAPVQDSLFGFVILANTGIGIVQELRAKRTLDSLALVGETRPVVRRDGRSQEVQTSRIVLGDLIETGPGDKIPVDGVCAEAEGLEIDESLLTGEADPVVKRPGDPLMSGSFVVAGSGAFTATKVGREAYAAQLAEEASRFTLVHSELRSGVSTILKYVTWMMVPTAAALIVSQMFLEHDSARDAAARTIGGIVPMVPEGLVLLTSLAFAIGVIRLGRKQCLVQELPAIEGLARVDVVCLDKTGTLTEGGMDVTELRLLPDGSFGAGVPGGPAPDTEETVRRVLGALGTSDPRPNASLRAIVAAFPAAPGWRCTLPLPFSSARKYSGGRIEDPDGRAADWLLGAPDVLLPAGDPVLTGIEELNAEGLRVLLLARGRRGLEQPGAAQDAEPAALVVLEQRLRPDAADTLGYFAAQDVEVKVVSGDNAVSVGAVAAKLRLPGAEGTVDARHLPEQEEKRAEFAEAVDAHAVFGRVSPQQKRSMVGALRSRGHTVAMTGDGVNDVLALKDADIGVAMGAGSEATRAVAQIVLLNNSFATLPSVVAEGRRVIGNITRVATLFLVKTVYSVLLAVLVACCQVEYPFLPRHLTLLSTLAIGVPAFFLALAPNKERARPHFVRRVMRYALPAGVLAGAATFATYLLARAHYTGPGALDAETSAATLTLFLISLWVLAIIARPYTWWRILLVATMGAGFLVVLVVPWLQEFFALRLVGSTMPWTAVGIAVAAAALLEPVWVWAGRKFPADQAAVSGS